MNINGMEYLYKEHDRLVREREDKLREEGYYQAINHVTDEIVFCNMNVKTVPQWLVDEIETLRFTPKGEE